MREDNAVLILDGCNKTAGVRAITYNADALPDDENAGITTNYANSYKASTVYVMS